MRIFTRIAASALACVAGVAIMVSPAQAQPHTTAVNPCHGQETGDKTYMYVEWVSCQKGLGVLTGWAARAHLNGGSPKMYGHFHFWGGPNHWNENSDNARDRWWSAGQDAFAPHPDKLREVIGDPICEQFWHRIGKGKESKLVAYGGPVCVEYQDGPF